MKKERNEKNTNIVYHEDLMVGVRVIEISRNDFILSFPSLYPLVKLKLRLFSELAAKLQSIMSKLRGKFLLFCGLLRIHEFEQALFVYWTIFLGSFSSQSRTIVFFPGG